ncbi:pyridoxamine 5'-phosphate oxidase family protein [Candidatus Harpocratesius sp.]
MKPISQIFIYGQVVILYTYSSNHKIRGREMTVLTRPQDEDAIWFGTSKNTRKIKDIMENSNVILNYKDPFRREKVILFGTMKIIDDVNIKEDLWREALQMFWPEGPKSKNLVLLKFTPNRNKFLFQDI